MQINYIIASYSGKRLSGDHKMLENVLDLQLTHLSNLFKNMTTNHVAQITIVEPSPTCKIYPNYYNKDKWMSIHGVPIVYLPYIGNNTHHSYDQFLQAMLKYSKFDYHIIMEDDYYIDPTQTEFDTDLINIYTSTFKDNIGYLCTYASLHQNMWHASISNGMISKDTLERLGKDILEHFYSFEMYPQLKFSHIMTEKNINICDIQKYYKIPFWDSPTQTIKDFTTSQSNIYMFVPVQMTL